MAASREHQQKWKHNRLFLASLLFKPDHPDWILVAAFYTAVHAVEAALATDNFHPDSHFVRHKILSKENRYTKIWEHYHSLYNGAWVARYDCSACFTHSQVCHDFVKSNLFPLERSVCVLLGSAAPELDKLELPPKQLVVSPA